VVLPFLVLRLALVRSGARSQETRKQSLTAVLDAVSDLLALLPPALAAECGTAVVAEEVAHATPGALLSREEKRVALSFDPKKHCAEEQRLLETLISRALGAIHDKSQEPYTPVCAL
jgi:hypothetical protein